MILIHNNPTSAKAYSFLHMSSQLEQSSSRLKLRGSTVAGIDPEPLIQSRESDIPLHPPSQPLPDDVLRCVLDLLDVEGSPEDRMTCARCARVCQAWQDPALRVLWHTLRLTEPRSVCPLYRTVLSASEYAPRMWLSSFRYDPDWAEYLNRVSASVMSCH